MEAVNLSRILIASATCLLAVACSSDSRSSDDDAARDGGGPSKPEDDRPVPPPQGLWVRSMEGVGSEGVAAITARPDGSFVVLGSYEGPGTFNPGQPDEQVLAEPDGASESVLAHYAADGGLVSLRVDPLGTGRGRVLMAGDEGMYVTGSGAFAAGSVMVASDADVFVARYAPDGTPLWARSATGAAGTGSVTAVAALPDGGVVIGGSYEGTITFADGEPAETRLASTGEEIFLARYDADGELLWAKRAIAAPYLPDWNLAAAADGGIAVYGVLENVTTFNPGLRDETELHGGNVGFVVMLDDAGSVQWARAFEATEGTNGISDLVTFADGGVVVTGSFTRTLTLGPGEPGETLLAAVGSEFPGRTQFPDLFAARFGADGELSWARREGGEVWDGGGQLEALEDGATLLTGSYTNTVTFADGEPAETTLDTEVNEMSPFVAIVEPDGSLRWVREGLGGQAAYLADGSIAIAGAFTGTLTVFPGEDAETTLASAGAWDVYVVRLGWPDP